MGKVNFNDIPTAAQFENEMKRLRYKQNFHRSVKSTLSALITIVAAAVIVSTMLIPVLRVTGASMTPTLRNDEYVLCSKVSSLKQGDIIAFYYNNRILLKRVIGVAGDIIDIDEDGTVTLNGEVLDEPYISEKALGECDIDMPYQVPENRLFCYGRSQVRISGQPFNFRRMYCGGEYCRQGHAEDMASESGRKARVKDRKILLQKCRRIFLCQIAILSV